MQTQEILQHFYEKEVEKRRQNHLLAMEVYFQASKDSLAEDFRKAFQRICRQLQQQQVAQQKGPLAHITFSLLRTALLEKKYIYLVEGTDEEWFFDIQPILTAYDATWAFRFFEQFIDELTTYSKTFAGAITQADIESIKLQEVTHFHQYVISLARYALADIIQCSEYMSLSREPQLEIRIGEYLDVNEVVYNEDFTVRDSDEIKAWLEQNLDDEYPYEVFNNLNLSSGNYEGIDIRYAFFLKTNLIQSQLRDSLLIGANFSESKLIDADLSFSTIHEANFSHSQMQGVNLQQVQGAIGLLNQEGWEMPGYLPVLFTGANLEGANFELADLRGACFIGANVKYANFTGANLEKAMFSKEAQEHVSFDPIQATSIIWKE
ncbi:pentapeptide repeat-containing protein [Solibacillus merdavium]|uniref:Pentapeptide repeat-containing protein n=1 Tax=Solibacillus merdavium TaxID=2762218 RepID=A0ABR8XJA4_9BACL|nr:pentapeptide repeat-containing protein [Solibacillus merdavium]MBD8032014.1 pentapeptide repeat-containing protein [Solibacillus merdavium]